MRARHTSLLAGFLVITLQHNPISNHTLVLPSLVNSNQRRITLTLEEKLQYAPPGYTTGTEVLLCMLVMGMCNCVQQINLVILNVSSTLGVCGGLAGGWHHTGEILG